MGIKARCPSVWGNLKPRGTVLRFINVFQRIGPWWTFIAAYFSTSSWRREQINTGPSEWPQPRRPSVTRALVLGCLFALGMYSERLHLSAPSAQCQSACCIIGCFLVGRPVAPGVDAWRFVKVTAAAVDRPPDKGEPSAAGPRADPLLCELVHGCRWTHARVRAHVRHKTCSFSSESASGRKGRQASTATHTQTHARTIRSLLSNVCKAMKIQSPGNDGTVTFFISQVCANTSCNLLVA